MTSIEIPTLPVAPAVNPFAERLWSRLPQVYRDFDALGGYPFLLYIDAVTQLPGDIHTVIERILGSRAVGPATPEPWSLSPEGLQHWRDARVDRISALGDPFEANNEWLDWLAQFVGARLDWAPDVVTRRNAVRYAVSGWKAGTRPSIQYAARPVLTGSQYAKCMAFTRADEVTPTEWDIAIITRSSETPDPAAVLDAIARAGVKPAGAVLHHKLYEATWDILEARRPTWDLWSTDFQGFVSWDRISDTGLSYASVPGNLLTNSSFEDDLSSWSVRGANTTATFAVGGLDGFGHATLTAIAAGQVSHGHNPTIPVDDLTDLRVSVSLNPAVARTARIRVTFDVGGSINTADTVLTPGTWSNRLVGIITAPSGSSTITDVAVQVDGLALGEIVGADAYDMRAYTG